MTKSKADTAADTAADLIKSLYTDVDVMPSIGISIIQNMGGDRQLTAQTFYPIGSPLDAVNALLDSVMAPIKRQVAMAEMVDLRKEQLKTSKALAQFKEDYDRIGIDHASVQARRAVEIEEMEKAANAAIVEANNKVAENRIAAEAKRKEIFDTGYNEFVASGRNGEYNPAGHVKTNLARQDEAIKTMNENNAAAVSKMRAEFDGLIAEKQAQIMTADAERDQHKTNLEVSLKRYGDALDQLAKEIAEREAVIG